jgi:hypothetical protein
VIQQHVAAGDDLEQFFAGLDVDRRLRRPGFVPQGFKAL